MAGSDGSDYIPALIEHELIEHERTVLIAPEVALKTGWRARYESDSRLSDNQRLRRLVTDIDTSVLDRHAFHRYLMERR